MNRRKQLIEQFKQMKPRMGVFAIRSRTGAKCVLEADQNIDAKMNSSRFQLDAGLHPNRELQKEWKEHGEDHFEFEVLELLPYDKEGTRTDYREDLEILKMEWEDRLTKENVRFYRK